MSFWKAALAAAFCCLPILAFAQGAVVQSQPVTPGHAAVWVGNGTIADEINATIGPLIGTFGVQSNSSCSVFINSGPLTGAYEQLCLGTSATGASTLSAQGVAGATNQPLNFVAPGGFQFNGIEGSPIAPCATFGVSDVTCSRGNWIPPSVQSYGAVCDGTTNDHTAIQAAANAGIIYVPPNTTCYSASPISVTTTNGLEIIGGNKLTSILLFGGSAGGIAWTGVGNGGAGYPSQGQGVSVHDIAIETETSGGGVGLSLTCTAQPWVRIYNSTFQGWSGGTDTWNNPISITNCTHSFVDNNFLWGENGGGIIAGSVGIALGSTSSYVYMIHRNEIQGFDAGINIVGADVEGVHIDDNHALNNVFVVVNGVSGNQPPGFWIRGNDYQCDGSATFAGACIQLLGVAIATVEENQGFITNNQGFITAQNPAGLQVQNNYVGTVSTSPYQSNMIGVKIVSGSNTGNIKIVNNIWDGMLYGADLDSVPATVSGNMLAQTDVENAGSGTQTVFPLGLQAQSISGAGGVPSVSSCGTSPAVSSNSSNLAGQITTGSGSPTSCTLTFAAPYSYYVTCVASPLVSVASFSYVQSRSGIVFTFTGSSALGIAYVCNGS